MITNPPPYESAPTLERDPRERRESARGDSGSGSTSDERGPHIPQLGAAANRDLDQAAGDEREHQERSDRGSDDATREPVQDPPRALGPTSADASPARRDERPRGVERDRGDSGTGSGRGTQDRDGRAAREEHRGQPEDEREPGHDEAEPSDQRASRTSDPPGREDRELRRRRARQQVRRGDAILELVTVDPLVLVHAHAAKQRDVRRRSPEADATEPRPAVRDGAERNALRHASSAWTVTMPRVPSTVTRVPSGIVADAPVALTTAGMPSSRDTIAA